MNYVDSLHQVGDNASQIESLFRSAQRSGETSKFAQAVDTLYQQTPQNLLYAAWHYRFVEDEPALAPPSDFTATRTIWQTALILSVINGLLFWLLSDMQRVTVLDKVPLLAIVWAPIYAVILMAFLVFAGGRSLSRWLALGAGLAVAAAYPIGTAWWRQALRMEDPVSILLLIHLTALALYTTGFFVLWEERSSLARFAALNKAIETVITAGIFLAAGVLFTGVSYALFQALGIDPPDWVMHLFVAGGVGLVPVLAVAAVYRPDLPPQAQSFTQGLSRLIALVLRILLPLALVVAVVYVVLIPFNFMRPFENRETLIVYNVMLFAVLGLIVGATPVHEEDVPAALRSWLRRGLLTLAALALLVAVYAMAAVLYRTWSDGITPNRFAVIGWNLVNIALLVQLLYREWRSDASEWLATVHATVNTGLNWYVVWTVVLMIALPLLFH
ncbi:MAG: hypothetical protein U0175_35770 [Caldilineaceae bacterium]